MVLPLGDLERTRIVPVVTYLLITINVVVYALQLQRGPEFDAAYAVVPFEISHRVDLTEPVLVELPPGDDPRVPIDRRDLAIPQAPGPSPIWLTLLTSMFLHGSPLHLAGNMLYLWIFGDNVEEVLGRWLYLGVYLACGVVGSILQIIAAPDSVIPCLGASGAIAGVMGMYVIWFPHHRIRVLVFRFITEMPALYVIGLWILIQVWQGYGALTQTSQTRGVAYLAHVGGALTGILAAFLFRDHARYHQMRWGDALRPRGR